MNFQKISDYIKNHKELFSILGLGFVFYLLFFYNLGAYPLIDVDETRYVEISRNMWKMKDIFALHLNGDYFFEKPPLFFWIESLAFMFFGHANEIIARLPVALCATLSCFMVYFVGKKIVSRKYGIVSSLILATSFQFLLLAHIAIIDMLLSTCIAFSLYSGFMTFFCKEKNKKFFWWGMYAFAGLAVLAKGLPGLAVPFGTMFLVYLFTGKIKEFFKPVYFFVGVALFLLISLPWHLIMIKMYDPAFFETYIVEHHLQRFLNSDEIGREESWAFYIPVLFIGFLPWTASFFSMLVDGIRHVIEFFKDKTHHRDFNLLDNRQKFIALNIMAFAFVFFFFSASSTKLPTYQLPVFFPMAFLLGAYWRRFMFESKHKKGIAIATWITNVIFITASVTAVFTPAFLPTQLAFDIQEIRPYAIAMFFFIPLIGLIALSLKDKRGKIVTFASYVVFMICFSIVCTTFVFELNCKFGQDDLMEYALWAKKNNTKIATFDFGRRYSVIYYYENNVEFEVEPDYDRLKELLASGTLVIVRNDNLQDLKDIEFKIVKTGRKYSLISK